MNPLIQSKLKEFRKIDESSALTTGEVWAYSARVRQYLITVLQEALIAGVKMAEGCVPEEITGPQGPREEYQASADGFNSCRTETLAAIEALKEDLGKESV